MCSQAKYNHKKGSLTVKFTEEIMPYLAQVKKKFLLYNLKEVSNFGSLYSTRLYELIQQFKETGWAVYTVEKLREIFSTGKKFEKYNDFKRKTFEHAIKEINNQFKMNLNFTEIKEGKRVASIRFEFNSTKKMRINFGEK